MLIKFSQSTQGGKQIHIIPHILQKVKLRLKRKSDFPEENTLPTPEISSFEIVSVWYEMNCVNKALWWILKWGVMPFLVFNAVIGIMFLLALNCVFKCYSSVYLERKKDRAHAIIRKLMWIFIFSLKGLDGCPTVSMMVRSKLVNATDRSDWCSGELGPQLCSGRCPVCWRDNCRRGTLSPSCKDAAW